MPAVARVPLGASTVNRKWYVDVDTSESTTAPVWIGVFGITSLTPGAVNANLQDDSDFDSAGFGSQTKTGESWTLEMTVKRATVQGTPTAYDPGQEHLRLNGAQMGVANSVHIRWYEMEPGGPRVEAYEGWAAVTWNPNGGGPDELATASVTLAGQGRRIPIAHPDTVA